MTCECVDCELCALRSSHGHGHGARRTRRIGVGGRARSVARRPTAVSRVSLAAPRAPPRAGTREPRLPPRDIQCTSKQEKAEAHKTISLTYTHLVRPHSSPHSYLRFKNKMPLSRAPESKRGFTAGLRPAPNQRWAGSAWSVVACGPRAARHDTVRCSGVARLTSGWGTSCACPGRRSP